MLSLSGSPFQTYFSPISAFTFSMAFLVLMVQVVINIILNTSTINIICRSTVCSNFTAYTWKQNHKLLHQLDRQSTLRLLNNCFEINKASNYVIKYYSLIIMLTFNQNSTQHENGHSRREFCHANFSTLVNFRNIFQTVEIHQSHETFPSIFTIHIYIYNII